LYNVETARAALEACSHDLDREEDRMRTLEGKLTQLAAFSGVSISISGGLGGTVLAGSDLQLGLQIALGTSIALAALALLAAVVVAFVALSPKLYLGVDEQAVIRRTTPESLNREPSEAIATYAASRRDALLSARKINDRKARATTRTFALVAIGFSMLVVSLLIVAVGSVV
jgi:hypothetical protein